MITTSKKQDLVLFVAPRKIYFVQYLVLRLTMFKDKKCVLLCSKGWEKVSYISNFIKQGLFDDLLFFDLHINRNNKNIKELGDNLTSEFLEKTITTTYDEYFYNSKYSLDSFSYVVTNSDVSDYDFDLYLNIKEKNHIFLEFTADKFFRRKDRLKSTSFSISKAYKELFVKYQAFNGKSEYCTPFFHPDTKKFPSLDIYYKFFYKEELARISEENIKKIFTAYEHKFELPNFEDSNILYLLHSLASHANAMRDNPVDAAKYIVEDKKGKPVYHSVNQIALDYLVDEGSKIFLKTHPTDPFTKRQLDENYNGNVAITDMPGEFLAYDSAYKNFKWSSTIEFNAGHYNISTGVTNNYKVTRNFARVAFLYNRIYFTLQILQKLDLNKIYSHEINPLTFAPLVSKFFNEKNYELVASKKLPVDIGENNEDNIFLIRDLTAHMKLDESVLKDSKNIYVSLESEEVPFIEGFKTYKFEITKKELKTKGRFLNLNTEYFYILSKENLNVSISFPISKKLYFCGIEVTCNIIEE